MTGNISDIDYISGSDGDQEGGIIVVLKDGEEITGSTIEFDMQNLTFEVS